MILSSENNLRLSITDYFLILYHILLAEENSFMGRNGFRSCFINLKFC